MNFNDFRKGDTVHVLDGDVVTASGIIVRTGSVAHIVGGDGVTFYSAYDKLVKADRVVVAQQNILKQEEKDDHVFVLQKIEDNAAGEMSIKFIITVDDEQVYESEEVVTNTYDMENGWSAPDDFDDNKLELMQNTAESGFDVLVESYTNIRESATNAPATGEDADAPADVLAFAPGEGSGAGAGADAGSGGGGGGGGGGEMPVDEGGEAEAEVADEEGAAVEEAPVGEEPVPVEEVGASLGGFKRSILSSRRKRAGYDETMEFFLKLKNDPGYVPTTEEQAQVFEFLNERGYDKTHGKFRRFLQDQSSGLGGGQVARKLWLVMEDEADEVSASIKRSSKTDNRLHGNPQHRLNPNLRAEMARRGIDSGNTNDLELAEKLKGFDYGKAAAKIQAKLNKI